MFDKNYWTRLISFDKQLKYDLFYNLIDMFYIKILDRILNSNFESVLNVLLYSSTLGESS